MLENIDNEKECETQDKPFEGVLNQARQILNQYPGDTINSINRISKVMQKTSVSISKDRAKIKEYLSGVETKIDDMESENNSMVNERTWEEFRSSGMLWFINTILHAFGWAIVCSYDENGDLKSAFPTRVKFRGFSEDINTEGYKKVAKYMHDNASDILDEANQ